MIEKYLVIGVGRKRLIGDDIMIEPCDSKLAAENLAMQYASLHGGYGRYFVVKAEEMVAQAPPLTAVES